MGRGARGLTAAAGREPSSSVLPEKTTRALVAGEGWGQTCRADAERRCVQTSTGFCRVRFPKWLLTSSFSPSPSVKVLETLRSLRSENLGLCPSLSGQTRCRRRMAESPVCREPMLCVPDSSLLAPVVPSAEVTNRTSKLTCWAGRHLVPLLKPRSSVSPSPPFSHLGPYTLHYLVTEPQKNTKTGSRGQTVLIISGWVPSATQKSP